MYLYWKSACLTAGGIEKVGVKFDKKVLLAFEDGIFPTPMVCRDEENYCFD